jgi:hypothetical protein
VLRRLEQELLAFKLDTQTKLTEEARHTSPISLALTLTTHPQTLRHSPRSTQSSPRL